MSRHVGDRDHCCLLNVWVVMHFLVGTMEIDVVRSLWDLDMPYLSMMVVGFIVVVYVLVADEMGWLDEWCGLGPGLVLLVVIICCSFHLFDFIFLCLLVRLLR